MSRYKKLEKLKEILRAIDSAVLAFSGGVDSTFLLRVASRVLPKHKLLAVTATSATYTKEELASARKTAGQFGARHKVIKTDELKDKRFSANPPDRCYFCKKELFVKLAGLAKAEGLKFVIDASNVSDKADYRPGAKAKKELGVRSPLEEAGLSKEDIRQLSKKLGIKDWNRPALACLASRIPYGRNISEGVLRKVDGAERYLRNLGFPEVRVRHYNGLCRIEVEKKNLIRLLYQRDRVIDKIKKLGYNYVTLDLEGYRTGSLNEVIKK